MLCADTVKDKQPNMTNTNAFFIVFLFGKGLRRLPNIRLS